MNCVSDKAVEAALAAMWPSGGYTNEDTYWRGKVRAGLTAAAPFMAQGERDAVALLTEWQTQWSEREDMPAKMSGALHVRTALCFAGREGDS